MPTGWRRNCWAVGPAAGPPADGLMGFERPCPFCRVGEMSDTEPHVREHVRGGRVYQLSGKVIDWAGIPAHLEYIHDITEKNGPKRPVRP